MFHGVPANVNTSEFRFLHKTEKFRNLGVYPTTFLSELVLVGAWGRTQLLSLRAVPKIVDPEVFPPVIGCKLASPSPPEPAFGYQLAALPLFRTKRRYWASSPSESDNSLPSRNRRIGLR